LKKWEAAKSLLVAGKIELSVKEQIVLVRRKCRFLWTTMSAAFVATVSIAILSLVGAVYLFNPYWYISIPLLLAVIPEILYGSLLVAFIYMKSKGPAWELSHLYSLLQLKGVE